MNEQKMFCWQCQETAGNKGCTVCGVCGKTADVAALQDELVYETKRLSQVTTALRKDGKPVDKDINHLVTVNLFITITNANFDADAIKAAINGMENVYIMMCSDCVPGVETLRKLILEVQ